MIRPRILVFKFTRKVFEMLTPDSYAYWYDKYSKGHGPLTDLLSEYHIYLNQSQIYALLRGFVPLTLNLEDLTLDFEKLHQFIKQRILHSKKEIDKCEAKIKSLIESLNSYDEYIYQEDPLIISEDNHETNK